MSIFRPHKSKPRQFNYYPRYFDPVKEERNQRRKILHGTSTESDGKEYTPGKYIRTQREARDASRESDRSAGLGKLRGLVVIAVVVGVGMLWLMPRIMDFVIKADEEKRGISTTQSEAREDEVYPLEFVINESIDIANQEGIETLNDEVLQEIEENEWRYKRITIVPNE
jgi:hypothetical protein